MRSEATAAAAAHRGEQQRAHRPRASVLAREPITRRHRHDRCLRTSQCGSTDEVARRPEDRSPPDANPATSRPLSHSRICPSVAAPCDCHWNSSKESPLSRWNSKSLLIRQAAACWTGNRASRERTHSTPPVAAAAAAAAAATSLLVLPVTISPAIAMVWLKPRPSR
ncbi:hypothetical protein LZ31DRAFT_217301 [Colletotrichum somersetense]|nr:hypothetical protein LZ31DRAFT_217301 [Colletotrichum somersetense]